MTQQRCLKLTAVIILNNHSYSAQRISSNMLNAINGTWRIVCEQKDFPKNEEVCNLTSTLLGITYAQLSDRAHRLSLHWRLQLHY